MENNPHQVKCVFFRDAEVKSQEKADITALLRKKLKCSTSDMRNIFDKTPDERFKLAFFTKRIQYLIEKRIETAIMLDCPEILTIDDGM